MTNLFIYVPKRNGDFTSPFCLSLGTDSYQADLMIKSIRLNNPTYKLVITREQTLPFCPPDCDDVCEGCPIADACSLTHNDLKDEK